MTYSDTEPRGTLRYRLLTTSRSDPGQWGHEYVRHLAAELGSEYQLRHEEGKDVDDLRELATECATFFMAHNAEADAVDLLEELEFVEKLKELVDKDTFGRVCLYMVSCVNFLPPPDDVAFLQTAHDIYIQQHRYPEALALAIRLSDPELIATDFRAPANS
jgi:26S proteasome regulatory subunit N1